MNLEQIKSSGLLEQYVLGLLSPAERQRVDALAEQHPELKTELRMLQEAMEKYAKIHSVKPPKKAKGKILSRINVLEKEEGSNANYQIEKPATTSRFYRWFPGVAAAAIVGLLSICYLLYSQAKDARTELAILQQKVEQIEKKYANLQMTTRQVESKFTTLKDLDTRHVHLRGANVASNSLAVIYWNPNHKKGYLNVIDLPKAPHGHQYQIWADVNGKHLDMGLLDSINSNSLLTIPFIENSRGFVITLEEEGGSVHPTVERLAVKGTIDL